METETGSTEPMTVALMSQFAQNTTLHLNLGQNAILTTEDKVRLILMTHLSKLEKKKTWMAPFGIFITILTTFVTTNFKSFMLIPATTWEAIFVIAGVLSFSWMVYTGIQSYRSPSLDDIVSEFKKSGEKP